MRAAIYARVSTDDQDPAMQLRELEQYCERRQWRIHELYTDEISGSTKSRPALDRMMKDAGVRRFDAVVVWKFDRFARSVPHLVEALDTFHSLGIQFVSLTEQIDTTTPAGRMVFTVIAAVAEFERTLIRERVRAGIRNARKDGVRLGRPAKQIDAGRLLELRHQGLSLRKLSKELHVAQGTILKALRHAQWPQVKPPAKREGSAMPQSVTGQIWPAQKTPRKQRR